MSLLNRKKKISFNTLIWIIKNDSSALLNVADKKIRFWKSLQLKAYAKTSFQSDTHIKILLNYNPYRTTLSA